MATNKFSLAEGLLGGLHAFVGLGGIPFVLLLTRIPLPPDHHWTPQLMVLAGSLTLWLLLTGLAGVFVLCRQRRWACLSQWGSVPFGIVACAMIVYGLGNPLPHLAFLGQILVVMVEMIWFALSLQRSRRC